MICVQARERTSAPLVTIAGPRVRQRYPAQQQPLTAPEDQMDISVVKRIFGSRVAVAGNISTDLLSRGSAQEVENATRRAIEETEAGGGYRLMAAASVHSGVKPQNNKTMVETPRRFGSYA